MNNLWDKIRSRIWADKRLLLVVVLAVLVFMMMDFNNRMTVMLQLDRQEHQLQTQKVELQQTKVKIESDIVYANSERALEEWAREEARLINDGDTPIVLLAGGSLPATSTPEAQTNKSALNTWEVWRELIFGSQD